MPTHREDPMSQLLAIDLLVILGWDYPKRPEANAARGGRLQRLNRSYPTLKKRFVIGFSASARAASSVDAEAKMQDPHLNQN
jgi:hypothetical protein